MLNKFYTAINKLYTINNKLCTMINILLYIMINKLHKLGFNRYGAIL